MKKRNKKIKITPYFYVLISFLSVILVGSVLLYLPISAKEGVKISYIDALFTSVSATCVTGLSTVNIASSLSLFGKVVLAILIEIGGLSFLTIAVFVLLIFGKRMSIGNLFLMKEALNQPTASNIRSLIKKIVLTSITIQGIFIVINFVIFILSKESLLTSLEFSVFHTISSFNNAGFDIFGSSSMIPYAKNIALNISTMCLIILGGLGFVVIADIFGFKKKRFSFHTKVVLTMSFMLIIFGTILIKFMMFKDVTLLEALFTSVSTRTAGFTTIDLSSIASSPAFLVILVLMFIGASPCSTGGGIKTTTFFTMIVAIFYLVRGKRPKAFGRKISIDSILKAFILSTIAIVYCTFIILIIYIIQKDVPSDAGFNYSFASVVFEVVSAFGTVGLSVGLTPYLYTSCKILICITMFIGRLGPLTIASIWNNNWMKNTNSEIDYIEEKIMIG